MTKTVGTLWLIRRDVCVPGDDREGRRVLARAEPGKETRSRMVTHLDSEPSGESLVIGVEERRGF
jgi:hypothetical protein